MRRSAARQMAHVENTASGFTADGKGFHQNFIKHLLQ